MMAGNLGTGLRTGACTALMALGLALTGTAAAQQAPQAGSGEITVFGRRFAPDEPRELSRPVTFRDLDLSTDAGVTEFRRRIRDTATALCTELGEPPQSARRDSVIPSCFDAAVGSTGTDVRRVISTARQRVAAR